MRIGPAQQQGDPLSPKTISMIHFKHRVGGEGKMGRRTRLRTIIPRLQTKIDKVPRERNLPTNITELTPNAHEKRVLFAQRFLITSMSMLGYHPLKRMLICICDFGEWCKEKQNYEEGHETGYTEVDPLHVFEALVCIDCVGEEDS